MRKLVWGMITSDEALADIVGVPLAEFNETYVMADQAVDSPKARPFMILRWGPTTPGMGAVAVRTLTVWIHDAPADYTRIDRIALRLRTLLEGATAMQDTDGGWLTQAEWAGTSDDLADDAYGTITRNIAFRVIGSAQ